MPRREEAWSPVGPDMRRLYNLSAARFAFANVERGWLKVSRLADLNDPFEMLSANLRDQELRAAFKAAKRRVHDSHGVVCFTETWRNPVMWSHYGDKHAGVCLGYDVGDELTTPIRYNHRLQRVAKAELPPEEEYTDFFVDRFLTWKFSDWEYEQERRIVINLADTVEEAGHAFIPTSNRLVLREVILGPRFTEPIDPIRRRVEHVPVRVTKARIAFTKFGVTEDRRFRSDGGGAPSGASPKGSA